MPLPTRLGLALLYLYPVAVLAYDAVLKFGFGLPTISDYVWSSRTLMGLTCLFLITACAALVLHLGGKFFDY